MNHAQEKIHCIIHCRVSTGKQAQEGESLGVQESICLAIAHKEGWVLAHKPWLESISGRKERSDFEEILDFLDKHPGKVKKYILRSIDRFTRGGYSTYDAMKRALAVRGVEMVDSTGVIQPAKNTLEHTGFSYDWSVQSPSEITEAVVSTTAKHEVTNILTRLIGQEILLTQRGFKIRAAADGYLNVKVYVDAKKRTIQEPDPIRAKYYTTMFELRATGQLTDREIVARINAMGFRTPFQNRWDKKHQHIVGRSGGVPLTIKHLQEIIKRPIYCGMVWEKWTNWTPIKAPYEGLVPLALWNAANRGKRFIQPKADGFEILHDHKPEQVVETRTRHNSLFPYKNIILCPRCKSSFTASISKNKLGNSYAYYHCARKHKQFGVPREVFDKNVQSFVKCLRFKPDVLVSLKATMLDRYHERQGEILRATADMGHSIADLEIRKADAVQNFKRATTETMRHELELETEKLDKQIKAARSERTKLEITESDIESFTKDVESIMEHPAELLLKPDNQTQQEALFSMVFDELPTYEDVINGTPKLTWVFALSLESFNQDSELVRLPYLGWNTIESTILNWRNACSMHGIIFTAHHTQA